MAPLTDEQKQAIKERMRNKNANVLAEKKRKVEKLCEESKEFAGIKFTAPPPPQSTTGELRFNSKQQQAIDFAKQGREFCLIGPAGSGKTFTTKAIIDEAIRRYNVNPAQVNKRNKPIAIVAFTNKAIKNTKKHLREIGAQNIAMTAHLALNYQPEFDSYLDEEGVIKYKKTFRPYYTGLNPMRECQLIIVEEASSLPYETLFRELKEAAPNAKFIFIGDLNQLPPVFGEPTLAHKLMQLPVVELTHIYRQALESPIIHFQHNYTLKGEDCPVEVLEKYTDAATDSHGLEFVHFKKQLHDPEDYCRVIAHYMYEHYKAGRYSPTEDMVLIPFNKKFGTIGINNQLADLFSNEAAEPVYEVIAGFKTLYLAVGDLVTYKKEDYRISRISRNKLYVGDTPQEPSVYLDREGINPKGETLDLNSLVATGVDLHQKISGKLFELPSDEDSKTHKASHEVELIPVDSALEEGETWETLTQTEQDFMRRVISEAGDFGELELNYCTTIHKSQGSEWRKVWLILHRSHATMLNRELLYTGMTRAAEKLTVLYSRIPGPIRDNSTINKAIQRAKLDGLSWQEKAEYFLSKRAQKRTEIVETD